GQGGSARGDVGPMLSVGGTLVDPALQQRDLVGRQLLAGLRGRHELAALRRGEALERLAVGGLAGQDRAELDGGVALVEAKVSLALLGIGTMAGETGIGEDGPDVAVIVEFIAS